MKLMVKLCLNHEYLSHKKLLELDLENQIFPIYRPYYEGLKIRKSNPVVFDEIAFHLDVQYEAERTEMENFFDELMREYLMKHYYGSSSINKDKIKKEDIQKFINKKFFDADIVKVEHVIKNKYLTEVDQNGNLFEYSILLKPIEAQNKPEEYISLMNKN